ncbi:hypothetical protein [Yoonia sp. R2-816]
MHNTQHTMTTAPKGAAVFEAVEELAAMLFVRPRLDNVKREVAQ